MVGAHRSWPSASYQYVVGELLRRLLGCLLVIARKIIAPRLALVRQATVSC